MSYKYIRFVIPQDKDSMEKLKLPSINRMISGHFSVKASARKRYERFFKRKIVCTNPPVFDRAVVVYHIFRDSFLDEDNCYSSIVKICNDALVNIGVLATDKFPKLRSVVAPQQKAPKRKRGEPSNNYIVITIRPQPTEDDYRAFITTLTGMPVMWKPSSAKSVRGSIRPRVHKKRSRAKTLFQK